MVNVGKYTIHGSYGHGHPRKNSVFTNHSDRIRGGIVGPQRLGREVYFEGGSQEVTWRGGVELIFNGE